jgi:hypothetical protein
MDSLLEYEIVRIAGRRGKHDDDRHTPMFEEAHKRSIEWFVASPQP